MFLEWFRSTDLRITNIESRDLSELTFFKELDKVLFLPLRASTIPGIVIGIAAQETGLLLAGLIIFALYKAVIFGLRSNHIQVVFPYSFRALVYSVL